VSPKHWRDADAMVQHAQELVALAPNIAIKAPAIPSGIAAMEQMAAAGASKTT
jgi:transaldolase